MTRCICPAWRGCRRVWAGTGCDPWVPARWRHVTRERGKKRCETGSAFRQAVVAMVQRYSVEDLVWFRLTQHNIPRPVRAYRGQPARVDHERHATVEVRVDEAA